MSGIWRIKVLNGKGQYWADDTAPNEEEARQQAAGWTGQRGQMTWTAIITNPDGTAVATYKRGREVAPC